MCWDDYTVGPLGPTPGADNNSQGQPYLVTVAGGGDERDGWTSATSRTGTPGLLGIIGNQVWVEDRPRRDLRAAERRGRGGRGVTVELLNAAGAVISTTMTGCGTAVTASHRWRRGTYGVRVTDVNGHPDGLQSDADRGWDRGQHQTRRSRTVSSCRMRGSEPDGGLRLYPAGGGDWGTTSGTTRMAMRCRT